MPGQVQLFAAVVGALLGVKFLRGCGTTTAPPRATGQGASHSQPTVAPRARGRRKYPVTYPAPVVPQLVLPQDQRLGSWGVRWKIELRLLALQLALAAILVVGTYLVRGRALAEDIVAVSVSLVVALMLIGVAAATASALWQVGRHKLQPQRWEEPLSQRPLAGQRRRQLGGQPLDPAAALAAAQALLADLGGPKVALAEPAAPKPLQLTGTWDKDREASDSMEAAIRAMRLNPLVRRGVALVRGLELKVTDEEFEMAVFSAIPWFKVVERYPFSGEDCNFKRRDLRRGGHVGHVEVLGDGSIQLHVTWGQPLAGSGSDTFSLAAPGVLHARTVLALQDGPRLQYTTVYRLRGGPSTDGERH
mmetsp:Transcript_5105/g.14655  ORF Transcript_5105/g.14655 Transcript_5105/m.14655 type:complete len:362 (-) Transcript_5105:689-1774(-)